MILPICVAFSEIAFDGRDGGIHGIDARMSHLHRLLGGGRRPRATSLRRFPPRGARPSWTAEVFSTDSAWFWACVATCSTLDVNSSTAALVSSSVAAWLWAPGASLPGALRRSACSTPRAGRRFPGSWTTIARSWTIISLMARAKVPQLVARRECNTAAQIPPGDASDSVIDELQGPRHQDAGDEKRRESEQHDDTDGCQRGLNERGPQPGPWTEPSEM